MELLVQLFLIVMILVIPIKLAAIWVGAQNTRFISCLLALFVVASLRKIFAMVFPGVSESLGMLISISLESFAYMMVLETTFIKGIIITVIQSILMIVINAVIANFLPDILIQ
jgi:hypothetical protein